MKWLTKRDEMGVPRWLWGLFWMSIAFLALCCFAPLAVALGW